MSGRGIPAQVGTVAAGRPLSAVGLFAGHVWAIVQKDLLLEARTRELFASMVFFAILVGLVFNFAFELRVANVVGVLSGAVWTAFLFAAVLGLNRSFALEREDGSLEGLVLSPINRSALFAGKLIATLLFMLGMEVIVLAVFSIFFNVSLLQPRLLVVSCLGAVGITAVGTVFASLATSTRAREVLLPVLLFPVLTPVIVSAVKAMGGILDPAQLGADRPWITLLIVFDTVFLVVAWLCFEYTLEE